MRQEDRPGPGTDGLVAMTDDEILDAAWEALRGVMDPELCMDVVSLGLIYGIYLERGQLRVEMTMTTPGCPVSESLPEMARCAVEEALRQAVGQSVDSVEVLVVWDPPWDPSMMDPMAAMSLGLGRQLGAPRRR